MAGVTSGSGCRKLVAIHGAPPADITDTWASLTSIWDSQTERYDPQQQAVVPTNMADDAGPGHWNDADMMIVGMVSVASGRNFHSTNLSPDEQYTHVARGF